MTGPASARALPGARCPWRPRLHAGYGMGEAPGDTSLASDARVALLDSQGLDVVANSAEDPDRGGHEDWRAGGASSTHTPMKA